jgi:hypothetical protein
LPKVPDLAEFYAPCKQRYSLLGIPFMKVYIAKAITCIGEAIGVISFFCNPHGFFSSGDARSKCPCLSQGLDQPTAGNHRYYRYPAKAFMEKIAGEEGDILLESRDGLVIVPQMVVRFSQNEICLSV